MSFDELSVSEAGTLRSLVAERLREIRTELFGPDGGPELARLVGVSAKRWAGYEDGVMVPAEVALAFIDVTGCCPRWLLMGMGPKYQERRPAGRGTDAGRSSLRERATPARTHALRIWPTTPAAPVGRWNRYKDEAVPALFQQALDAASQGRKRGPRGR
jgi:hypothetical protein